LVIYKDCTEVHHQQNIKNLKTSLSNSNVLFWISSVGNSKQPGSLLIFIIWSKLLQNFCA